MSENRGKRSFTSDVFLFYVKKKKKKKKKEGNLNTGKAATREFLTFA